MCFPLRSLQPDVISQHSQVEGEDDWHKALQRLPWCPHTQRVEESRRLAAMSQCTGLELREAAAHGLWEMSVLQKHHEVFLQSPEVFPALLRGLRCELPNVLEFTTGACHASVGEQWHPSTIKQKRCPFDVFPNSVNSGMCAMLITLYHLYNSQACFGCGLVNVCPMYEDGSTILPY